MLFIKILWAFLSVGILGAVFGLGLAFASKYLSVKKDKRIAQLNEALPGINCGTCGYPGCEAYAEAIIAENIGLDLCKPGGQDAAEGLARVMGVEIDVSGEKLVAQVHCTGGPDTAQYKFKYEGIHDCNAAYALYGGHKACPFGCLGLGSCVKVCPVDAIYYNDGGLVWVNRDLCISCGKCVDICPTGVMKMIPYDADVLVACSSTDKGAAVRKYCKVGCIACKRCEKASPEAGFIVENFLATIDYKEKGERSEAKKTCPTGCIVPTTEEVENISDEQSTPEQDIKESAQSSHEKS